MPPITPMYHCTSPYRRYCIALRLFIRLQEIIIVVGREERQEKNRRHCHHSAFHINILCAYLCLPMEATHYKVPPNNNMRPLSGSSFSHFHVHLSSRESGSFASVTLSNRYMYSFYFHTCHCLSVAAVDVSYSYTCVHPSTHNG